MTNIDYIMNLLDWNNTEAEQKQGLKMAQDIKCISVFLQPGAPYGKNVWDNCAEILAAKTDDELEPHLSCLLEWLQDMNWPGAYCILKRLQMFGKTAYFDMILSLAIKKANMLQDQIWENNLGTLRSMEKPD